ncbi:hypothetical protein LJR029_003192 [Caballeronia sp. LjRoot29]|uniref:hypothetical protein n=1 Tax=Caballeronia sp. LjRoot29 TaxID=3342315 RepID=UPI003ECE7602
MSIETGVGLTGQEREVAVLPGEEDETVLVNGGLARAHRWRGGDVPPNRDLRRVSHGALSRVACVCCVLGENRPTAGGYNKQIARAERVKKYMRVLEKNNYLASTRSEARHFLKLTVAERAESDWYRSFLLYPAVRNFFSQSIFAKGTVLRVTAVTQIAMAYVACVDDEPSNVAPTSSEVRGLMKSAKAFESELNAESASWLPSDVKTSFHGPLRNLQATASSVETRSAGRPAISERRVFVSHLARALYGMCGEFPGKFIAAVAARVWEDTDDRTIRKILTDKERSDIIRLTKEIRRQTAESENAAHLLLKRTSVPPKILVSPQEPQTINEILKAMLALAKRLPDETAVILAVDCMETLCRDIGVVPDFPPE